jgi:hypothetical protein
MLNVEYFTVLYCMYVCILFFVHFFLCWICYWLLQLFNQQVKLNNNNNYYYLCDQLEITIHETCGILEGGSVFDNRGYGTVLFKINPREICCEGANGTEMA